MSKNVHSWKYRPYLIKKNKINTKIVEIQEQRIVGWASYPENTLNPSHWALLLEKGIFRGFFVLEDRISMNQLHFLPFNSSPSHQLIVSSSIHFPLSPFMWGVEEVDSHLQVSKLRGATSCPYPVTLNKLPFHLEMIQIVR